MPKRRETVDGALTNEEIDVARLIAQGISNQEIAKNLHICNGAVHSRVKRIKQHLQLEGAPYRKFIVEIVVKYGNSKRIG